MAPISGSITASGGYFTGALYKGDAQSYFENQNHWTLSTEGGADVVTKEKEAEKAIIRVGAEERKISAYPVVFPSSQDRNTTRLSPVGEDWGGSSTLTAFTVDV
jgi:hypothetical protein